MQTALKPEHKVFCENYIFDFNATRAYKVAYPNSTDASARSSASELLTKPNIQAFIEELQADLAKTLGISKSMILREHQKLAFSSMAGLRDDWITLKEFNELTSDQKACISEIQTQTRQMTEWVGETPVPVTVEFVKIKLYDKQKSLDSISKMLGFDAPKKIEHSGSLLKNYEIVPASKETRSK